MFDQRGVDGVHFNAIEFLHGGEHDAGNGQVQAHANGIGGDEHLGFAGAKALRLGAAYLGPEGAVDDGGGQPAFGQHFLVKKDVLAREDHEGVAGFGILDEARLFFHVQGLKTLAFDEFVFDAQALQKVFEYFPDIGRTNQHQMLGRAAHDGLGPGPAPVLVGQHLHFVDDHRFELHVGLHHLDRGSHVAGARDQHTFFARQKRACDAFFGHAFLDF